MAKKSPDKMQAAICIEMGGVGGIKEKFTGLLSGR